MQSKVTAAVAVFMLAAGLIAERQADAQSYPNRLVKVVRSFRGRRWNRRNGAHHRAEAQ